jgi:hypothetical protein
MPLCSLCCANLNELVSPGDVRERFTLCPDCGLLQRDRGDYLSPEAELAFYNTHQNCVGDAGYLAFLSRLAEPLAARLTKGSEGLDFGSGPAPALALLMSQAGFPTVGYDPLFSNNVELLAKKYDFVSCTEVVEHFRRPSESWAQLFSLVRPGGILAVMTEWYRGQRPLSSWRYARDPTHVVFYQEQTFHFLAKKHQAKLELPATNVCLFIARPIA